MRSPFLIAPFGGVRGRSGGAALDPDVQAFIAAAGITDGDIISEVDWCVKTRKAEGCWEGDYMIAPMLGGAASPCTWNLRNLSLNLTFFGGWTYSATGAQPNGANAYFATGVVPSDVDGGDSINIGYYSRTDSAVVEAEAGCANSGSQIIRLRFGDGLAQLYSTAGLSGTSPANTLGYLSVNRLLTSLSLYRRGVAYNTVSGSTGTAPDKEIKGACYENSSNARETYSAKECGLFNISKGRTAGEELVSAQIFEEFMVRLNRSVL